MAQVLSMIDSRRNYTPMGEPTNIEYDIHAQNPDQGELSAAAINAAAPQQLGHPAQPYGGYGGYSKQGGGGSSFAGVTAHSAQPAHGFHHDNDGGEEDNVVLAQW